jgi:hypothetical protein
MTLSRRPVSSDVRRRSRHRFQRLQKRGRALGSPSRQAPPAHVERLVFRQPSGREQVVAHAGSLQPQIDALLALPRSPQLWRERVSVIAVWTRCRTLSFRMLPNQVPLLAPRRARVGSTDRRPAAPGGGSAWPRPPRRGTLASTPNTSICAHLRTRSATMMTRASLDPIFLQKIRKRFRGDRPPDDRACEYSTSCIDMRADEVLISACAEDVAGAQQVRLPAGVLARVVLWPGEAAPGTQRPVSGSWLVLGRSSPQ